MNITREVLQQYEAAHSAALAFDFSNYAKVEVTGKDARSYLHNLCTNDIKSLKPGFGCEAFFTTAKARVVAHVFLSCIGRDAEEFFLIDSAPGSADVLVKHLNHFLISEQVEIVDRTAELAMMHVCGPLARQFLTSLGYKVAADLQALAHASIGEVIVRRNDRLGLPGYDVITPAALRPPIEAVEGNETFEILRIEAGVPLIGKDMDENRFVMEVGRTAQAVSFNKGCYLGQEPIVMARDRGHVNRFLVRIQLTGQAVPAAGTKLLRDSVEVGEITSSALSPSPGPIALAFVRRGHQDAGTEMQLSTGESAKVIDGGTP